MLKTKERIITAQDLAEATTQAIANAQQEPLVVMENGRPAAYLISVDMFDTVSPTPTAVTPHPPSHPAARKRR